MIKKTTPSRKPTARGVPKRNVPLGLDSSSLGALLLREAENLAREKCLTMDAVVTCLEGAFQKVVGQIYESDDDSIGVAIHPKSGVLSVWRWISPEPSLDPTPEMEVEKAHDSPGETASTTHNPMALKSPLDSAQDSVMDAESGGALQEATSHTIAQDPFSAFANTASQSAAEDLSFDVFPEVFSRVSSDKIPDDAPMAYAPSFPKPQKPAERLKEELPVPIFNRVTIQHLKHALMKNIHDLEREKQYEEFKDRVGQIVSCSIKQMDGGNLIVEMGRVEAIIPRHELIPRENYIANERVKAYIYDVRREAKGPQIFLSRAHPGFLMQLMAQEIPEIYDGLIEIKAVARDPGSRSKVAIVSREDRLFDAIGACVGVRGSRVNAIGKELCEEKIDIIPWSADLPVFVVNALVPAEIIKVVVEDREKIRVIVADNQQGIAIGKRGQNVKLAHQLTGVKIEIITESQDSEKRVQAREEAVNTFVERLDLDDLMAHFLVSEGFETIEDLIAISPEALSNLQGMTIEIAQELRERAIEAQVDTERELEENFYQSGGEAALVFLVGFPKKILPLLTKARILTLQDLGDLSVDEVMDILGKDGEFITEDQWGQFILDAREQGGQLS